MMGAAGEAARIFITVGLNTASAAAGLKSLASEVDTFGSKMNTWKKTVEGAFGPSLDMFGRIGDAADGIKSVGSAVAGVAQTIFSGAARNEQYAMSFEVLMGSAEKATAHIDELKKFAAETPFTLPGIVDVSKQLEVMGGSALNTIENIRLVGDVASGAGVDIERVGIQFGRLYDGLKNGTPLGEVMMRLGEMGAISGESRRKIMGLAEAVQSGAKTMDEAWAEATKEFGRFSGVTMKQAESLGGLWSTFTDTLDDGFARIGTKLLPMVKPVLKGAIDLFEKLADAALWAMDNFELFAPVVAALLIPAIAALTMWMWGLAAGVIAATWPFLAIGAAVAAVVYVLTHLSDIAAAVVKAFQEWSPLLTAVLGPLTVLPNVLGAVADALGIFGSKAEEETTKASTSVDSMRERMVAKLNGSRESIAVAADNAFSGITASAEGHRLATEQSFRLGTRNILDTWKGARDVLSGAATEAAKALYDPIILQADIALTKQAMKDKDLIKQLQSTNATEKAEGQKRLAQLQQDLMTQTTLWTTYGDRTAMIAKTKAVLTRTNWTKMLEDGTPEQDAAILLWKKSLEARLEELEPTAANGGKKTATGFKNALRDNMPKAGLAAEWGAAAATAYADGWAAKGGYLAAKVRGYINKMTPYLESHSPPDAGPLKRVDDWGANIGTTFADMLAKQAGYLGSATKTFLSGAQGQMASAPTSAMNAGATAAGRAQGGLTLNLEFASAVPYSPGEMEEVGRRVGPAVYEYLAARGAV